MKNLIILLLFVLFVCLFQGCNPCNTGKVTKLRLYTLPHVILETTPDCLEESYKILYGFFNKESEYKLPEYKGECEIEFAFGDNLEFAYEYRNVVSPNDCYAMKPKVILPSSRIQDILVMVKDSISFEIDDNDLLSKLKLVFVNRDNGIYKGHAINVYVNRNNHEVFGDDCKYPDIYSWLKENVGIK